MRSKIAAAGCADRHHAVLQGLGIAQQLLQLLEQLRIERQQRLVDQLRHQRLGDGDFAGQIDQPVDPGGLDPDGRRRRRGGSGGLGRQCCNLQIAIAPGELERLAHRGFAAGGFKLQGPVQIGLGRPHAIECRQVIEIGPHAEPPQLLQFAEDEQGLHRRLEQMGMGPEPDAELAAEIGRRRIERWRA